MPATSTAAKKAAKKTVAKKAPQPVKKAATRSTREKVVLKAASAQPTKKRAAHKRGESCACKKVCKAEQAFWVNNGPVVHSVAELKEALRDITDEQFLYHTKRAGNDFACWLRDCLGDDVTATRVEKARGRSGALRALSCSC